MNRIVIFPSPDAVQEFRVTTAVAPAEFGRAGGAIVNASIKSGTNQIHGTVYGTVFGCFRDRIFDANPLYFALPGTALPPFQRKQFGFGAGDPLWNDQLFIFGDYQALRQKKPQDSGFQTVPTALMRQGIFTELPGLATTTLPSPGLTGWSSVTIQSGTPAFTNPDGDIHDGFSNPEGTYTTSAVSNGFGSISGTRQQSERQMEFAARINFSPEVNT